MDVPGNGSAHVELFKEVFGERAANFSTGDGVPSSTTGERPVATAGAPDSSDEEARVRFLSDAAGHYASLFAPVVLLVPSVIFGAAALSRVLA